MNNQMLCNIHQKRRHCAAAFLLGFVILSCMFPVRAEPSAIRVENKSSPTLCAEDDNVDLRFYGTAKQWRISAKAPAFMGLIARDQTAPDFTDCVIKDAPPEEGAVVNKIVLYEDQVYQLVGYRKTSGFWRKSDVDVRVGETHVNHLELLQWHIKHQGQFYEFLVLYPSDGYWRLRLLPPQPLAATAYGTSFLIGPVEQAARPYVALKSVSFDPDARAFTVAFVKGGEAVLALADLTAAQVALDVTLSKKPDQKLPFMAMRSMFVRADNADSAVVAVKSRNENKWDATDVMAYRGGKVSTFWLGRLHPSRHNTSAPDMQVDGFKR
jgi:hypothetical protein